jgi:CYTH domain-containing protein
MFACAHHCQQSDPSRITVKKKVHCFIYNNQYFQLSTFLEPNIGISVLETETEDAEQKVTLPAWLQAEKEVTTDDAYSSYKIAKHKGTQKVKKSKS